MPRGTATMYRCFHDRRMTSIRGPAARACPGSTHEGVDAMGRGRQKAKQTKVARELKYFSPETDYDSLQRELGGGGTQRHTSESPAEETDGEFDDAGEGYADWTSDRR